jgi:choline dehydrogenase-like flavoprotein
MSSSFRGRFVSALCSFGVLATVGALPQATPASNNATFSTLSSTAQAYDYVIVGGGLSGLVVANRLSENSKCMLCRPKIDCIATDMCRSDSVLVLEFGIADRSNQTLWPGNAVGLNIADMFNITSVAEPGLQGQHFAVFAGAVAGGGSTVNGMEWDRASIADYDSWKLLGNPGWGWSDLLPYFKKVRSPTNLEVLYSLLSRAAPSRRQGPKSRLNTTTHMTLPPMAMALCRSPILSKSEVLTTQTELIFR